MVKSHRQTVRNHYQEPVPAILLIVSVLFAVLITPFALFNLTSNPILAISLFAVIGAVFLFRKQATDLKIANEELNAEIEMHRRTEQELEEALSVARDANEAKSRFLAGMTHELRTPLNAIIGFAQIMENDLFALDDAKRQEYTRDIRVSGERLLSLVKQVLDVASIEAGKINFHFEEISLPETVQRVTKELLAFADQQEVTIIDETRSTAAGSPRILGDQDRVFQVLSNLCDNAIKYNNPGGKIWISTARTGDLVRVTIRDTGLGIAREEQARVFDLYRRSAAHSPGTHGYGVGLGLSRDIIVAMGGRLGFESEIGVGSAFWFELPAIAAQSRKTASLKVRKSAA